MTKAGAQLRSDGVARAVHKGETGVRSAGGLVSSSAEPQRGSKERAPRNKPASLQASVSPALEQTSHSRASAPQNEREVAEALQIGREMAEGGSTVDARRGDGGSLHSGGSVTRAGAQFKSADVAGAVHKDETRVKTPVEGSLSSEGGSVVDARRGDDGPLHRGGEAAGAEITSTSAPCGRSHTPVPDTPALQTEPTVETDVTGVDLLLSGSFDTGGLVSSIVKPHQRSRERAPRNKSASLRADLVAMRRRPPSRPPFYTAPSDGPHYPPGSRTGRRHRRRRHPKAIIRTVDRSRHTDRHE